MPTSEVAWSKIQRREGEYISVSTSHGISRDEDSRKNVVRRLFSRRKRMESIVVEELRGFSDDRDEFFAEECCEKLRLLE